MLQFVLSTPDSCFCASDSEAKRLLRDMRFPARVVTVRENDRATVTGHPPPLR